MEITNKKGFENLVVDHLSRLDPLVMQPTNDGRIKETFSDESLLTLAAVSDKRIMSKAKKYFGDDLMRTSKTRPIQGI